MKKQIAGTIVFLFGLFLFFGNTAGFFRTVPYAGFITMAVGGILMKPENKHE